VAAGVARPVAPAWPETPLLSAGAPAGMLLQLDVDPVLVGLVLFLLLVIFFVFLFLRRIVTGFTEGLREGRER
jgi:hypothetical protein